MDLPSKLEMNLNHVYPKPVEVTFLIYFFPSDSTAELEIKKHHPKCSVLKLLVKYLASLEIFSCKIQDFYKLFIQDV